MEPSRTVLETHGITEARGFLPNRDPLERFDVERHRDEHGEYLATLDELGERLPSLLDAGESRPEMESLDRPPGGLFDALSDRERVRLCLLSGFFASGYVHERGSDDVDTLPAGVAVPLHRTSELLGRKPILSYDILCLQNFRRIDTGGELVLENLDPLQQFTTLSDERWFTIIHIAIEAAAGAALVAAAEAQSAIRRDEFDRVLDALETVAQSLETQTEIMGRMVEGNDPAVFATEFRPYYEGFDEVMFEGVEQHGGEPQTLRGGSGAQSGILPSIDSALGIEHESTVLLEKLLDMRSYMPEQHREVIDAFERDEDIRPYVRERHDPELRDAFNDCIEALQRFRKVHFGQVIQYIRAQTGDTTGTGGTDYTDFLGQMESETAEYRV